MDFTKKFLVEPGTQVQARRYRSRLSRQARHRRRTRSRARSRYKDKLTSMQRLFYGDRSHALLIVLQGHRRRRQGRHLLARDQRHGPAGRQGAGLQAADARGARARLPLARPSACARQGRGRGVQSLALRGCAGRARPQARSEAGLEGALRLHQRLGEAARTRTTTRPSSNSFSTFPRTSSSRASRSGSTIRGRQWKISDSDYTERDYWDDYIDGLRGRAVTTARRNMRPGSSSRPTTNGFAISRSRRSSPTPWKT